VHSWFSWRDAASLLRLGCRLTEALAATMLKVMKAFVVLFTALSLVGLGHADLKSQLKASNTKLDAAMRTKDLKGLESLMKGTVTSDFQFWQEGKSQDFKTFIGNLTASIGMMESVAVASTKVVTVKEAGAAGSGTIEHTLVGTMKSPDKKVHSTRWVGTFAESYRKVGGQWKTVKISTTSQKYFIDGKRVKM
jgi:hypothetical protein